MLILLVAAKSSDMRHQPVAPLGLLAIATHINTSKHKCIIFDRNIEKISLKKEIERIKPDIVGISAFTGKMLKDVLYVSQIAKKHNLPVVLGGVHASLLPHQTLDNKSIDYVVVGEGEATTMDLLDALENKRSLYTVDGLAFIDNGKVIVNKERKFIDLSEYPITDWTLVKGYKYYQGMGNSKRLLRIYTSKGCPGNCTFCYNQSFHKRTWRGRTPQQILDQVKLLIQLYSVDGIGFIDELWSMSKERVFEICDLFLRNNIKISWYFNARVDQYNKEDLKTLYKAGCRWILFGIESGCNDILKMIKKGIRLENVSQMFQYCNDIGISTIASFMIGFPGETEQNLKETIDYALSLDATYYDFTRYMCYPGTELYKYAVDNGLFEEPKTMQEWAKISSWDRIYINMTKVTKTELTVINNYFAWLSIKGMTKRDQKGTFFGYLRNMFRQISFKSIANSFYTFYELIYILSSILLHPRIRIKYSLNNKNKKILK